MVFYQVRGKLTLKMEIVDQRFRAAQYLVYVVVELGVELVHVQIDIVQEYRTDSRLQGVV